MSHTIIPDIHADFSRMEWSIKQAHSSDQLIFLGDLIDAGKTVKIPTDLKVLRRLRELTDNLFSRISGDAGIQQVVNSGRRYLTKKNVDFFKHGYTRAAGFNGAAVTTDGKNTR